MLGMFLSGSVLVLVFWPAVRDDDKKVIILFSFAIQRNKVFMYQYYSFLVSSSS